MAEIDKILLTRGNFSQKYFLDKFETDVQCVFDYLSTIESLEAINVKSTIKKGSIFLKGDFILPLQSANASKFFQVKDVLFEKLKGIPYVKDVNYASNGNLVFFLNRPILYRNVFQEVLDCGKKYGMVKSNRSVLVFVHNFELNELDALRIDLIASHLISLFVANNVETYCYKNDSAKVEDFDELCKIILCSESYSESQLLEELKQKAQNSKFKMINCNKEDNLCLDGKRYIENYQLTSKYGKRIKNISINNSKGLNVLFQAASLKHLIEGHMSSAPDCVVHIVNHQKEYSILEAGLLYEMLEKPSFTQLYLVVQSTHSFPNSAVHVEDFIENRRKEISDAMIHKYESNIMQDKIWVSRIDTLLKSAIKFEFLKINMNMPLKLAIFRSTSEKNIGIFVQYNFARLSNLFRNFELKVKEGYYEPLPNLVDVDFGLLRLEEEWNLFSYVLSFPKTIQELLENLFCEFKYKTFSVNRISIMLSGLCHDLSLYYSRIRILGGQLPQLQKVMHARLWLLKGIYQVLTNAFILLNIDGLDVM